MGNTDSIPVVSQVKSTVQLISGDTEGAKRTQDNFFHECPGVSQVTSTVQLLNGDADGALETQKRCGKGLLTMADGIPVVGHGKALVHYAVGDTEGGHQAMKAATRTTGVMAGGAAGFMVDGPAGAVGGGIYGGALLDVGTTAVTGYVAAIENVVKNPNAGDIFDLAIMPVTDGVAGYGAGKMVQRFQAGQQAVSNAIQGEKMEAKAFSMQEQFDARAKADPTYTSQAYTADSASTLKIFKEAQALKGETPSLSTGGKAGAPPPQTMTSSTPNMNVFIFNGDLNSDGVTVDMLMAKTPLKRICKDTVNFFYEGRLSTSVVVDALENLLEKILLDENVDILEVMRDPSKLKICVYEDYIYVFTVFKTKDGGYIPLIRRFAKNTYNKLLNKAKILTRSEVLQVLKTLFDNSEIGEEKKKEAAGRGEHVINNNVLKFYRKIIDDYLHQLGRPSLRNLSDTVKASLFATGSRVYKAYSKPIRSPHDDRIQNVMIAKVSGFHIDPNSIIYGLAAKFLRSLVLKLMTQAPARQNVIRRDIRIVVKLMNDGEIYVDHVALELWVGQQGGNRSWYNEALREVQDMFDYLGRDNANPAQLWVDELRDGIFQG